METSILKSTKRILGLAEDYDAFDLDVITQINGAFSTLTQLGVGPADGFFIEDDTQVWADFINEDPKQMHWAKTYVYLKVRSLFDPPPTSYAVTALKEQIQELEWRLNVNREDQEWVDPDPEEVVVDG